MFWKWGVSMKTYWVLSSSLLLGACATTGPVPANLKYEPHTLTEAQMASIKSVITRQLIDPGSAQFSEFRARKVISQNGQGYQVCGHVNSKNRFGGYVGRRPFIGAFSPGAPEQFQLNSLPTAQFADSVYYACNGLGLSLG
mgnify:CR=1 FL=1